MSKIKTRMVNQTVAEALKGKGVHPLMAHLFASRGIQSPDEISHQLSALLPYQSLKNIDEAASRLFRAIAQKEKILIVADYDADGATACAVGVKGLSSLGAVVDFVVPNRFEYGYGLTPEIVTLAESFKPELILTVDNGIASVAGVKAAQEKGIEVLVTDHHLPGDELPDTLIVNPNQPDCAFTSKNLAGVGVMFYVLMALRAKMRASDWFENHVEPNLATLLDYVALGTVADVVQLDQNNRILVDSGLRRIRAGKMSHGVAALFRVAGRSFYKASTFDLGFTLGPRLNAAGRLDDMSLGIHCLLADTEQEADALARQLDQLNRERRNIETGMQEEALEKLSEIEPEDRYTLTLYREDWHQGVVGIVASRLKEKFYRPVIVFAPGENGEIKGSGRSIAGLHMRDALDAVYKKYPTLIKKFGGHAMAAGLTLDEVDFPFFAQAFEKVVQSLMNESALTKVIETDGKLQAAFLDLSTAEMLGEQVWGQGFPAPNFVDTFQVLQQKIVGHKHLKLRLQKGNREYDGMFFNRVEWLPEAVEAVYHIAANEWQGRKELQIYFEHVL